MKARIPRGWESLSRGQKHKLAEYTKSVAYEAANEQLNRDMRIVLDLYIKMVCMVLHDAFGFGEKRLMMFLGHHRRLFSRQVRMVRDGSQVEYLDMRMAKIFKKGGFPQGFFDEMLGPVEDCGLIEPTGAVFDGTEKIENCKWKIQEAEK